MTFLNTHPLTQAEQARAVTLYGSEVLDWADSTTALRGALRALDDALPTSNLEAVKAAYLKIEDAQSNLRRFFALRDIDLTL
jgi:hypothetical protein